jgi:hypothetical protein
MRFLARLVLAFLQGSRDRYYEPSFPTREGRPPLQEMDQVSTRKQIRELVK